MIRNLKVLMLTMMAASAVTASAAQAAPLFNSELAATTLTATQDATGGKAHQVFDFAGGTLTCNEAHLHGTQNGFAAEVITLTAEYTNCIFLGQVALVQMNACDFRFFANGAVDVHKDTNLSGNCKHHEQGMKILIGSCTVTIPEQTGLKTVKYINITGATGKKEITMQQAISNITYDSTGIGCFKQPAGTYNDGLITTGNMIIKGTDPLTGAQTNIEWTP